MKNIYPLIFICIFSFLNYSCPKPDITPAYLIFFEEDFKDCLDVSNYNNEHEQNYDPIELNAIKQQKFSDVFVSLNGKELGYWHLPCTIPLLPNYSGTNNIRIIPCVKLINTAQTCTRYLFVTPVDIFCEIEKEKEYRLPVKVEYVKSVEFPILEIFSQSTKFTPRIPSFPATIEIVYDEEFEKNIGKITLTDTTKYFDIVTPYFPMLGSGERQFWELSYKSENGQITTHLGYENTISGITNQDLIVFYSTKGEWKKAYIDISESVMKACDIASQVSMRLNITGIKDDANLASYFYFENIKLITMSAPY